METIVEVRKRWVPKFFNKPFQFITQEKYNMLLDETIRRLETEKDSVYGIILLSLTSKFRYREIVALTRKDFDFENNTITVNKNWDYFITLPVCMQSTRNNHIVSDVKVNPKIMKVFKNFFENTKLDIHNREGFVFFDRNFRFDIISCYYTNKKLANIMKSLNLGAMKLNELEIKLRGVVH